MATKNKEQKLVYLSEELPQGSEIWHEFRSQGIGGSEASALMGIGFTSINQLFALKTGRAEPIKMNDAMQRGHDLEPLARAAYEKQTGNGTMDAVCLIHPDFPYLRVSLDGLSEDKKLVLEIKCPGINTHTKAVRGNIPDYYMPQLQYQLLVAKAIFGVTESSHYYSYFPTDPLFQLEGDNDGALIPVEHLEEYQAELMKRAAIFWKCIETDTPPDPADFKPYTTDTIVERNDAEWKKAATKFKSVKSKVDKWEAEMQEASETLKMLASDVQADRVIGFGVQVAKVNRVGAVDYNAIPELKGVNIENYRKSPSSYYSIKPVKE